MCRSRPCYSPATPGRIGTAKAAGSTAELQWNPSLESCANLGLAVVNRPAHARTEESSEDHAPAEHRNVAAGEVTVSASREIASADLSNPSAQGGNGPAEKKIVSAAKKVAAPD